MSDDIQDNSPMLIGDPLEADEMRENTKVTTDDMSDAIVWWNEVSSPLFVNAMGEG